MGHATGSVEHYDDVIMSAMASRVTACSGAGQIKHQSSASLAFVRGIPQLRENYPHKGPVTRKKFPSDDVIMWLNKYQMCHYFPFSWYYMLLYEYLWTTIFCLCMPIISSWNYLRHRTVSNSVLIDKRFVQSNPVLTRSHNTSYSNY